MKLVLVDKQNNFDDVTSFFFKPEKEIAFKAGQFMHYNLPHTNPDDRGIERYFTIAAAPYENIIRITTRFSENGSSFKAALRKLNVEDAIEADGPEGEFVVDDPNESMVFIAGGIGITPFRSILLDLEHKNLPFKVTLLYANHDQNIVFKDELENIAKANPNFKIVYVFSPEHVDEKKIREAVADLQTQHFYVSGPEPMVNAIVGTLSAMNISADHIKKDWFPGYTIF